LEIEAFGNKAIRSLTIIRSPERFEHARGTIRKVRPAEKEEEARELDGATKQAFEDLEVAKTRRMLGQRGAKVSLAKDDGWRW